MPQAPVNMTTRLRQLLAAPGLIRAINVYDPLTARIAESLGFEAIALGGFQLGAHLCTTEPLLTMTEVFHSARYITQVVRIPSKVDCGAGFGDPMHVTRPVREAEAAGIACIDSATGASGRTDCALGRGGGARAGHRRHRLWLWDLCLGPQGRRQDRLGQAAILRRRSPPRLSGPLVTFGDS
jgi:isocitrate lyase